MHESHGPDEPCPIEEVVMSAMEFAKEVVAGDMDMSRLDAIRRDDTYDEGTYDTTPPGSLTRRQADFMFGVACGAQSGVTAMRAHILTQSAEVSAISGLEGVPLDIEVGGKRYRIATSGPLSAETGADAGLRKALSDAARAFAEQHGGGVL